MRQWLVVALTLLTLGLVGCSEPVDKQRLEKGLTVLVR